uniref:Nuclear valosin-containing protein-like n=1 Tax=Haemonchus contortus TaxID=6289 RepID=A0A7I5E7Y6_HAECO
MKSKQSDGFVSDPQLLPRIKEHCLNFPDQKFFRPEDVAFDLQRKYHEYSRKKYKPFVAIVREGLNRLKIKDRPEDMQATRTDNNEDVAVILERKSESTLTSAIKPSKSNRKRKAQSLNSSTAKVEDICISSDEDNDKIFETFKGTNSSNKSLLNLYSNNRKCDNSSVPGTQSASMKKMRSGAVKSAATSSFAHTAPRGIGNVPTFAVQPRSSTVTFEQLGGCDRQFLEVCRLAMHMKRPHTYNMLGLEPPKGFLVHGPPGCGKTLFAQAVAGQFDLPMIQLAATELVSGVSGDTEEKIRQLFVIAKQSAPCVLILDDIDAIAPRRETATREMERRIVSQLSCSLDELFGPKRELSISEKISVTGDGEVVLNDDETKVCGHVLVIGTTSRPDAVDGGLRRAGRFDCEISLGIPDEQARQKILHTVCKLPLDDDVDMKMVARITPGYVGADLNALVREAAKCAINRIFDTIVNHTSSKRRMTNEEIKEELDKVLMWLQADDDPSVLEKLGGFRVKMSDFERALENVQPSAKREGFATVPDVSWQDIGALNDIRQELEWNILFPVKRPEDFALLGITAKPQGILLCGPPGCGKTLLAKAVANETGMNFISVKGPELLNMYVGESERAVRTVFQRARDSSPCVIFFDEIDALCPKRSQNETSGGSRLVNQLLTEMDGVEVRKQVFLIGATNRPDIVDPAILRPGRLDKILFVDFPSPSDRADILKKTTKNGTHPKLSPDVDFDKLSQLPDLDGFTGADLAALVHEASIVALKARLFGNDHHVDAVAMEHFLKALTNIRPSVTEADRKKYMRMKEIYGVKRRVDQAEENSG